MASHAEVIKKRTKAQELRADGLRVVEIASELTCSISTIQRYIRPIQFPNSRIVPREERTCPICQKSFEARLKETKTHCSRECFTKSCGDTSEERSCQLCGKTFLVHKSELRGHIVGRGKYCSKQCYTDAHAPRPLICLTCKRAFVPKRRDNGSWTKLKYCSKTCADIANENFSAPFEGNCEYCGVLFKRKFPSNGDTPRFCSMSCASIAQWESDNPPHVSGEGHWNWKGGVTTPNELARRSRKYENWQKAVYIRDNNHCTQCGNGHDEIHAHHIFSFAEYPQYRYELWNGKTLCRQCHEFEHRF